MATSTDNASNFVKAFKMYQSADSDYQEQDAGMAVRDEVRQTSQTPPKWM